MLCLAASLLLLAGCGPSFSWQSTGTWRILAVDPVRDSANMAQIGIRPDQAHRYWIVRYSFTVTNHGRAKAEWVGVVPTFHPDFQARIRNRFGFEANPPRTISPGAAGVLEMRIDLHPAQEQD